MKKTYKNPILTVVNIQTAHLMQASAKMYGKNATGEGMGRGARVSGRYEEEW